MQPISQNINRNIFYNKNQFSHSSKRAKSSITPEYNKSPMSYQDVLIQQNNQRNKILAIGTGVFGLGALLLTGAILTKGGSSNSTKKYGKTFVNEFVSFAKDNEIPTLSECKSLNKKLKTFLQRQINLHKTSTSNIKNKDMPEAAKKLLLYGPPGTGKSYFAKVYAKSIDAGYTEVKYSEINSVWSGEHLENLKSICEDIISKASASPNEKFIVVFNEIDSLMVPVKTIMSSGSGHSIFKAEERSVFINYLDEIAQKAPNVTIIGTTNMSPKNNGLDGAMMSRFKNRIEVSYPDKECLSEALKSHLLKLDNGEQIIKKNSKSIGLIAEELEKRRSSFRDLDNLVESAKEIYLDDCLKNKKAAFKFDYIEQAKKQLDITDGEISGLI